MVLAGGEGKRLQPLTKDRAKPAVPFGGNFRLVDFALSNLVNAGHLRIAVLTQYKSHSLDKHIATTWRLSPLLGNYVTPVPAQMRRGPRWFAGSADAIYQNMNLISDERPDYICVFGADHIYRMDPRQMIEQHLESGAGVTVGGIRVPIEQAGEFGVIEPVAGGNAIAAFREKPSDPVGLSDAPDQVLASMGNYVFTTAALIEAVSLDAEVETSRHDLGGDIIPALVARGEAAVWDFADSRVPGVSERERGYWRDVGTLDAYFEAHMDLISVLPVFDLYNELWPILTLARPAPAREVRARGAGADRHGAQLDGLRGRRRLGRGRAPVDPVAARARPLARARRGLGADARRRRRARRDRPQGDPGQERGGRRGSPDRRRPRSRPQALRRLRGRRRRRRQGNAGCRLTTASTSHS